MKPIQIALLVAVILVIVCFFAFGLTEYFSLSYLQEQRLRLVDFYRDNPAITILVFILLYVALTGLSIPSATGLTLLAGAIFDLVVGVLVVSVASVCGASIAFVIARYLFREPVRKKFPQQLATINKGIEKDGAFYLFAIRLVPVIPFFVTNVAMSLTTIKLWTFFWVSSIGMLAGTTVFVNAGSQLGQLESFSGILSPTLVGSLVLLGVFPLLAKWSLNFVRNRLSTRKK
ncbi:MAG: TVP38/TMEM64 family protein [Gammaproteobacteria bacterium]|nr:TVP38/TMEM64 family protein [Gammaproteobacteria bacterium]MYD80229.1 TVP38/TMEM64 family protein [Gammaproteobacteria bacterium]